MSAVTELQALESKIAQACRQIAALLAQPPSDSRTTALRAALAPVLGQRASYAKALHRLQSASTTTTVPQDAAARRNLQQFGPYRLEQWPKVEALITRQTWPASFPPLITERNEFLAPNGTGMINQAMQALFALSNPDADAAALNTDESYPDVPMSGAHFVQLLTAAQRLLLAQGRTAPFRFLDMGCGGGSKVLTALGAFDVAHGVDFNPAYVAAAQRFMTKVGQDPDLICEGDALTFDDYGSYDVVYMYRPLKDSDLARQAETRMIQQARPGAIIIAPLAVSIGRATTGPARVEEPIFLAKTPNDDARRITSRALQTGCENRPSAVPDPRGLGFWTPLVQQSAQNGFALI